MTNKIARNVAIACWVLLAASVAVQAAGPPKEPAHLVLETEATSSGGTAKVILTLEPKDGIQINRYPRIRLVVPEHPGLTAGGKAETGAQRPPAPGSDPDSNYFKGGVDAIELALDVDPGATAGSYELDAKLTYFYCVKKSGFCAPARLDVKVPLKVD